MSGARWRKKATGSNWVGLVMNLKVVVVVDECRNARSAMKPAHMQKLVFLPQFRDPTEGSTHKFHAATTVLSLTRPLTHSCCI